MQERNADNKNNLPIYDYEGAEVFYGLRNTQGEKVNIIEEVLSDPSIIEIDFIGEPGAGKTTQARQFIREIKRIVHSPYYNGPSVDIYPIFFDDSRDQMIKILGKGTSSWTPKNWLQLNNLLIEKKYNVYDNLHAERKIVVLEAPVFGQKDRGKTAISHSYLLGRKIVKASVPDPRIQDISIILRSYITFLDDDYEGLKTRLMVAFNIDVGPEYDDSYESGKRLSRKFLKMAQEEHILMIRDEINRNIDEWRSKKASNSKRLTEKITLPDTYKKDRVSSNMKKKAAYYEYALLNELNLPKKDIQILFNPFAFGKTIHMY